MNDPLAIAFIAALLMIGWLIWLILKPKKPTATNLSISFGQDEPIPPTQTKPNTKKQ